MTTDICIEKAAIADLPSILEIERLCFGDDSFSKSQFVYLIKQAKGVFWIVKYKEKTVGYISLLQNELTKILRVYSIAIHPDARKKKLGQLLIERSIEYAMQNDLKCISLEVKTTNAPAIALYKKNGFVETGIKKDYYFDGSDAYAMKLFLTTKE